MSVGGKRDEPDLDEDIDAWIAWDEEVRHDVRLQAVQTLRRAVPDHADPRYARVITDALLASSTASANPRVEFLWRIDVITEADRRLGADVPGRVALAHALLGHHSPTTREGGLWIAAGPGRRCRAG
ncbi:MULTISPECIES: hypothetical protein [unclassified Streptomyces]|uniref:hypothetical protein n=1 Tax=unclassified Streptomyces TaxID=2593676 RepID=UPI0036604F17